MDTMPDIETRPVPAGRAPRHVAEGLFPGVPIHYVSDYEAMADLLDSFDDQRPSTCGAYVARYLLPPAGHPAHDGVPTTREDYLAHLAGTILEADEVEPAETVKSEIARLGLSDSDAVARFGSAYYAWPLRDTDDPAVAGTSPTGTARVVAVASDGALASLPLPARDADGRVLMDEPTWERLLTLIEAHLEDWRLHVVVNYEADQLLDPTAAGYADGLTAADPVAAIGLDDWGVGHFAGVGALWTAPRGERWLLLMDTYRERGFSRYEPQPAELVRRALVRGDGREGGLLLVLPRAVLDDARQAVEALGLEVRMWRNGSTEPEGWAWTYGR